MKSIYFQVRIDIPEGSAPYQGEDHQASVISEVIQHRAPHLYSGGGARVLVVPAIPVNCNYGGTHEIALEPASDGATRTFWDGKRYVEQLTR